MIVRQKPQASLYVAGRHNGLSIVVELLDPPVVGGNDNHASPHYRERMDMIIGRLGVDDGDFLIFHVDSRRYEPVSPEELDLTDRAGPPTPRGRAA
jgi:hypothetical protein